MELFVKIPSYVVSLYKDPMPLLKSKVCFRLLGCIAEIVFRKVDI